MVEHWVLGNWEVGPLEILVFEMGRKAVNNQKPPLKTTPMNVGSSTFHNSTIPLFHVRGKKSGAKETF
jgi:hypothetical protein